MFFTITWVHVAHAAIGVVTLSGLLVWLARGTFGARRHGTVGIGALYSNFVVATWIPVFATLYISPYLL